MDENKWLNKWIKPITLDNNIYNKINSGNYYIETFTTGAWTVIKELLLAYYGPSYLMIMRKQKWIKKLCYVDLFAGSGIIKLTGLKNYYLGSPLIVKYAIDGNFDNYYFFEQKNTNVNQLKTLVQDDHSSVYQGDSNVEIGNIISALSKTGVHSLIFIDPYAMEVKFDTIRKLSDISCDIIINVAVEEIKRAIMQFRALHNNTTALDTFFGDEKWKNELPENPDDEKIFDYYSNKIVEEARKKTPIKTAVYKTLDGHHYYLLFTATAGHGTQPKFFNIVKSFNEATQNLDGNKIMNFIKHNIEHDDSIDKFL